MRIWSLHPRYLDGKGLVALWREGQSLSEVRHGFLQIKTEVRFYETRSLFLFN
ncbi:pyrimidine dimer DNA glycosylase/endonuclease V [Acetomicrobium mobile]|uniref:pyrimidine dimer DNA glycosylase/endonuclease V n=1 Tax=Acetomicrobium mobile TaxID=97477 RepID=UPI00350E5125